MRISCRTESPLAQRFQQHPAIDVLTIDANHGWTEKTVTAPDQ
jgi:hypothetical protein